MLTNYFDTKFPKWLKVLCVIFGDAYIIYRVMLFVDSCIAGGPKKTQPLIVAIIECVLWPFALICLFVDLVHVCNGEKIHWLCDVDEATPQEDPNPKATASTSTSTEGATEVESKPVE